MKAVQKGFTLIELMIVVAIIGILAAIAIPAYQNYTIRAQVSEGSSLIGGVEAAFDEHYANTGTAANDTALASIGITKVIAGTYVSGVTYATGLITVKYGANANANILNGTVDWAAYASPNGDITWLCNDGNASTATLTAAGANLVVVKGGTGKTAGSITNPSWLPSNCQ